MVICNFVCFSWLWMLGIYLQMFYYDFYPLLKCITKFSISGVQNDPNAWYLYQMLNEFTNNYVVFRILVFTIILLYGNSIVHIIQIINVITYFQEDHV
jgi:hypothetical protein